MSYRVIQCQIAQDNLIYDYCDSNAQKAKLLYNAALFRIRQIFTGWGKDSRTDNEKEIFAEVDLLQQTYPSIKVKRVISYCHLEKLMRVTNNPDFFAGLPMQTAQSVIKHAVTDFSNWLKSLKAYKQDPSKFLGKPQMPHYQKRNIITCSTAPLTMCLTEYLLDIFVMKKALLTAILPLSSKTAGIYICLQTSQSTNIRL